MNLFKGMVVLPGFVLTLTVLVQIPALAQIANTNDDTILKQIIIFGRHSIRSSTTNPTELSQYAVQSYPEFEVPTGCLTPNGSQAETLLGSYYRQYLLSEGLMIGNDQENAERSYFRANSIERSWATAEAFQSGLIPNSTASVHSYPIGQPDPVFDPIMAGVVTVDLDRAATEAQAIFNNGEVLSSAYSGEYSLIRSVLFNYDLGTQPPPATPPDCPSSSSPPCVDPTSQAITLTANTTGVLYTGGVIDVGGLQSVIDAADPFVMQYADGLEWGWGLLTPGQLSQQTRLISLQFNIEMLSPYLNTLQSSNAASHVLRTTQQAVTGRNIRGAFGNAGSRVVVVISSDGYVAGLAGLLHLHWQLNGYQPDFCAPGGALVFELRQSIRSKEHLVRAFYTAQTFEQLRSLATLTPSNPPATMQLLIPGGSNSATDLDVNFGVFQKLMENAINQAYVENPRKEVPPEVLTGVSCQ
jgi:4-phytase/acid phosphatase